ncbi:MAG: ABC-2 transporter permease [Coriobacteriaceae bacterium]|nr:ABC-2 transporter permease [Coriobacteriaceae bacterium]
MIRMMKMELVVFKKYLKQLVLTLVFVAAGLAIGMGTLNSIPGTAFLMLMFSTAVAGAAYDEQNAWDAYRLVMPVSRRDIVFGRYAFNLLVACGAAVLATAFVAVLIGIGTVAPLPVFLEKIVTVEEGELAGMAAAFVTCACIGLVMSTFTLPAYFKLGQTKATQWLPFIVLGISIAPMLAIAAFGGPLLEQLQSVAEVAATSNGPMLIAIASLGISLAAYVASAFVAVKLYEARDM